MTNISKKTTYTVEPQEWTIDSLINALEALRSDVGDAGLIPSMDNHNGKRYLLSLSVVVDGNPNLKAILRELAAEAEERINAEPLDRLTSDWRKRSYIREKLIDRGINLGSFRWQEVQDAVQEAKR